MADIPNLDMTFLSLDAAKWGKFENYVIPTSFNVRFRFKDGSEHWGAEFAIGMSENETPTLHHVTVYGNVDTNSDPQMAVVDWRTNKKDLRGVNRWQLKFIEQHRFQLLEMALATAIHLQVPNLNLIDDISEWKNIEGSLDAVELKKITLQIHKRIRQKINRDFLQSVADIYTNAVLEKENPIEAIAERFHCAHRTAQEYATKARDEELLPRTTRGKVTVKKPQKSKEGG
jgi:hypothetical protein